MSAILLNEEYYRILLDGKVVRAGISVLRPECIILFKARAYLDLKKKKLAGGHVDSSDIKKHKKDILRLSTELMLEKIGTLPETVNADIHEFLHSLEADPFDEYLLKKYGLKNSEVISLLHNVFE